MPEFEKHHKVNHKADDMFALVADVESYPEFLPMCEALTIRDTRDRDGKTLLIADMTVGYKAIKETFTSQVLLKPDEKIIEAKYIDGPFKHLDNRWTFIEGDKQSSTIDFYIDYSFKNPALGLLMGAMFERAFAKFTQSFEQRADEIY
ncbi:type II toxin-antitoxin system RatA family toxin [Lentilitoribacter sp. EG35]|uniref:type II toxin-antitoxin system RatA family toxin n=1 Tax=Lentilitoribacter sp. EG35 TaxID=3234192 RepID=UPI0034611A70